YLRAYLIIGSYPSNRTECIKVQNNSTAASNSTLYLYHNNGTKMNAVLSLQGFTTANITGTTGDYADFLVIYLPNAPNNTITDAPSEFYQSNYYKGFYLGKLPGFTQVYPGLNATNSLLINYINGTYPIRIFELNNYTGGNAPTPAKPAYVKNNYSMP
ncbi:membrane-like protein required for N-linked glycosylation, partial [mine drainage metagenome]